MDVVYEDDSCETMNGTYCEDAGLLLLKEQCRLDMRKY